MSQVGLCVVLRVCVLVKVPVSYPEQKEDGLALEALTVLGRHLLRTRVLVEFPLCQ